MLVKQDNNIGVGNCNMYNILIVEDDRVLADGLVIALEKEGYTARACNTLKKAEGLLNPCMYDLVILDVNLPDGDGISFCIKIKRHTDVPVLILTACDTDEDEIKGLGSGADDYVSKPFNLDVLRARIKVLLRRKGGMGKYQSERFLFDFDRLLFYSGGREIKLGRAEQKILRLLVNNPSRILTRDNIIMKVWDNEDSVDENTLTVTVGRLRSKLGAGCIETVYGTGYIWKGDN